MTAGCLNVITTVCPEAVTLVRSDQIALMSRVGYLCSRLNVYATSAGVSGSPFVNFTPLRMVKVSVVLPVPHTHFVASQGVALPLCRVLTKASGSYTGPSAKEM